MKYLKKLVCYNYWPTIFPPKVDRYDYFKNICSEVGIKVRFDNKNRRTIIEKRTEEEDYCSISKLLQKNDSVLNELFHQFSTEIAGRSTTCTYKENDRTIARVIDGGNNRNATKQFMEFWHKKIPDFIIKTLLCLYHQNGLDNTHLYSPNLLIGELSERYIFLIDDYDKRKNIIELDQDKHQITIKRILLYTGYKNESQSVKFDDPILLPETFSINYHKNNAYIAQTQEFETTEAIDKIRETINLTETNLTKPKSI